MSVILFLSIDGEDDSVPEEEEVYQCCLRFILGDMGCNQNDLFSMLVCMSLWYVCLWYVCHCVSLVRFSICLHCMYVTMSLVHMLLFFYRTLVNMSPWYVFRYFLGRLCINLHCMYVTMSLVCMSLCFSGTLLNIFPLYVCHYVWYICHCVSLVRFSICLHCMYVSMSLWCICHYASLVYISPCLSSTYDTLSL